MRKPVPTGNEQDKNRQSCRGDPTRYGLGTTEVSDPYTWNDQCQNKPDHINLSPRRSGWILERVEVCCGGDPCTLRSKGLLFEKVNVI